MCFIVLCLFWLMVVLPRVSLLVKGLRKGNPLSHFLFVLAMDGITCLMKKAMDLNEFRGLQVNENVVFDILQFEDDTVIL